MLYNISGRHFEQVSNSKTNLTRDEAAGSERKGGFVPCQVIRASANAPLFLHFLEAKLDLSARNSFKSQVAAAIARWFPPNRVASNVTPKYA